ncbi:hypothetical protein, partial [Aetokthonos hydrillicola]
ITISQRVYANEVSAPDHETSSGKAAALVTQPATINSYQGNATSQTNRLKQITNSIPSVHNQPSLDPLDFLKDPSTSFKKFFNEKPNQTPQLTTVNPLAVPKPPLDTNNRGEINVTVSHF